MADFWEKFNTFPKEVQDYLLGDKSLDTIDEIGSKFKLSAGQVAALDTFLGSVSTKETSFLGFTDALVARLGVEAGVAKKLAVDIFGKYFLPLNEFYDGAPEKELAALGGKIKDYPELRVMVKKESAGSAAEEVVKEFLSFFPDEVLRHRFLELVDSRLREVRKESDLREILMRSPKVGGLGLDEETTQKIIDATAEKTRSVKIISDTEAKTANPPPPKPPVKIINPLPAQKASPVKEEKKEAPTEPEAKVNLLDALKKNIVPPPAKIETVKPAPPPPIETLPVKINKEEVKPPAAPNPRESVKNPRESKSFVPAPDPEKRKPTKGISDAELEREIQHIKHDQMTRVEIKPVNFEEIATGIIKQSQLRLNPEQMARLKTTLTARLKDIRDSQETKDILSRDYALGGMSFAEDQVKVIMPILEKEFEKISERLRAEAEEKISAERRFEEERKRGATETSRLAEEQSREKRFAELVGEKSRKAAPAAPKPSSGMPAVLSPAQTGKPKIQDIKYEPKLVGPVDEIGRVTLVDFRRLGATAKDATLKIKEKIESLKADSIKKWQEGISAWNGGEVNKLYLQLFGEALQKRKSLKDVSAEREAAKQPFLSPDEINAIMELNRSLRF